MSFPERTPRIRNGRVASSWLWASSSLWSVGFGTAPAMAWAACSMRSTKQGAIAAIYLMITVVAVITAPNSLHPDGLFWIAMVFNTVVGTMHGIAARRRVFDIPEGEGDPTPDQVEVFAAQRSALTNVRAADTARQSARELAETSPDEALGVRIGRIDIRRRAYPDGGLIDVNNVSAETLIEALGLDTDAGARLVRARETTGGFSSAAEASVLANLPPRALEQITDQLVFLPKISIHDPTQESPSQPDSLGVEPSQPSRENGHVFAPSMRRTGLGPGQPER